MIVRNVLKLLLKFSYLGCGTQFSPILECLFVSSVSLEKLQIVTVSLIQELYIPSFYQSPISSRIPKKSSNKVSFHYSNSCFSILRLWKSFSLIYQGFCSLHQTSGTREPDKLPILLMKLEFQTLPTVSSGLISCIVSFGHSSVFDL